MLTFCRYRFQHLCFQRYLIAVWRCLVLGLKRCGECVTGGRSVQMLGAGCALHPGTISWASPSSGFNQGLTLIPLERVCRRQRNAMPLSSQFSGLTAQIETLQTVRAVGRVVAVKAGVVRVAGLSGQARIGDWISIQCARADAISGEIVQLQDDLLVALPDAAPEGVALGDRVILLDSGTIAPANGWIGRVIDPSGNPLDGRPLLRGPMARPLRAPPPQANDRRPLGARLDTGMAVTNTFLPIVRGQRVGLFAGSGVGKSSLLGHLAKHMEADVVVIAMIGERGRELRHFIDGVMGAEGLKRTIVVTATSDQSPLQRRRCAWSAMAVAEHFRDQGKSVLFLADSITRFAEAHREIAVAAGEAPVLRGFPPSTSHLNGQEPARRTKAI